MNESTLRLARSVQPATPMWLIFLVGGIGAAMTLAAWAGGQWPLTVVVLLLVVIAFAAVVHSPHIGISVFLTTFLINYPAVAKGSGYLTINNALGAVFLGLLAWNYYQTRDAWYLREPFVRLLFLIGLALVVGTVVAEYALPDSSIQELMVRRIGAVRSGVDYTERQMFQYFSRVAFVIFVLQFVKTPRQLKAVFLTLLACILVAVPPAIVQYSQTTGEEFRIFTRLVNWADNVNRFAFGCVLGTAFLFYFLTTTRTALPKLFAAIGGMFLIPLVLLSASRSGLLGLCLLAALIASGAFGASQNGVSRATALTAVLILIGLALLTFFLVLDPRAQERVLNLNPFATERVEGTTSAQQRAESAEESFAIIKKYPIFGTGIGNFRWVNRYLHESLWKPPHNSYLWAAAEGGLILFGLYIALFVALWRRFGRLRRDYAAHADLPLFPNLLRVYMILILFFSFFADVWLEVHVFLLAASAALLRRWRTASDDTPSFASAP